MLSFFPSKRKEIKSPNMPSLLFLSLITVIHQCISKELFAFFRLTSSGILSSLQNSTCLQLTLAHRFFSLSIKSRTWWTYLNSLTKSTLNGYRFQTPLQHFPCAKPYTTFCNRISFSSTFLINKVWYLQSEGYYFPINFRYLNYVHNIPFRRCRTQQRKKAF